jgi:hypothetical protein
MPLLHVAPIGQGSHPPQCEVSPPLGEMHAPSGHNVRPAAHRASQKPVVTQTSAAAQVMIRGHVGSHTPFTHT